MDKAEILKLYELPLLELLYQAHTIYKRYFKNNEIQLCSLLSIKTGGCPEDCKYCPQSAHYKTSISKENLWEIDKVVKSAKLAKDKGATRFCMGAAWRSPPKNGFKQVLEMIKVVKALGMETCVTLGLLNEDQAIQLKEAGLDYYNHNLDTSPEYYSKIITTRTYQDRLDTITYVAKANIHICSGGILGMGESKEDRISLLEQLVNLPQTPKSVPINKLISIPGTPLANAKEIDNFEFVRIVAVARIILPASAIRLSANRQSMSEEMQALCFFAGANSIFLGGKLLVTSNPEVDQDMALFAKLGLKAQRQKC